MIIRISFPCDREIRGHMDVEAITHVLKQYTGTHKSKQRENAKRPKKSISTSKRGGELSTMEKQEDKQENKAQRDTATMQKQEGKDSYARMCYEYRVYAGRVNESRGE